jgi:hypothetical protein
MVLSATRFRVTIRREIDRDLTKHVKIWGSGTNHLLITENVQNFAVYTI